MATYLTNKHLSRRTVLKGMGVTLALPMLDAMTPAGAWASGAGAAGRVRLACIEMVHGAAGSTAFGLKTNMWSPEGVGRDFDLAPTTLAPLAGYRDTLTIVSNTNVHNAEAFAPPEVGGDHFRSSAVYLTQSHPKRTQGSDVQAGTSLDQFYAKRFGQDTPIPSMQLCIENVDQAGGCEYRLLVRVHRLDQLGDAGAAAADDPRSARGVRPALRGRRDARGARSAAP